MLKYLKLGLIILITSLIFIPNQGCLFSGLGKDRAGSRDTPKETMDVFRKALETRDYSTAYHCLSQNAQSRYQFNHFKMMFEYTIFGVLIKNMIISWEPVHIKYARNRTEAELMLRHQRYPAYKKDLFFIYEDDGWRIDFTLARILNIPQEDEDMFFPPQPEEESEEEKTKEDTEKKPDLNHKDNKPE